MIASRAQGAACAERDIQEPPANRHEYTLTFDIPAVELFPGQTGVNALGPFVTLPRGAVLEVCGDGFNDRTVKVRHGLVAYFVFRQDLFS